MPLLQTKPPMVLSFLKPNLCSPVDLDFPCCDQGRREPRSWRHPPCSSCRAQIKGCPPLLHGRQEPLLVHIVEEYRCHHGGQRWATARGDADGCHRHGRPVGRVYPVEAAHHGSTCCRACLQAGGVQSATGDDLKLLTKLLLYVWGSTEFVYHLNYRLWRIMLVRWCCMAPSIKDCLVVYNFSNWGGWTSADDQWDSKLASKFYGCTHSSSIFLGAQYSLPLRIG
jgi:hypothetical protein